MTLSSQIEALDVVEVTQADRDAVYVWQNASSHAPNKLAQAFARHRITALRLAETSSSAAQEDMEYLRGVVNEMGFPSVLEALESLAELSSITLPPDGEQNALADRVEMSAAEDVEGLVEDAKQLAEALDYLDARRTVFGLAATLTTQAQRNAELEKTLRWIFRNGLKHSSNRPDFVNKAFSDAFAAERAALKGGRDD